jgi:hypothetical protein
VNQLAIAMALVLVPTVASAQSTTVPVVAHSGGNSSSGSATYGPPAPAVVAIGPVGPRAVAAPSAADTHSTPKHRGHHHGAYMEADGGVTKPQ